MLVATALMALAVVLGRKWGRPEGATPMVLATWQLVFGGLVLAADDAALRRACRTR